MMLEAPIQNDQIQQLLNNPLSIQRELNDRSLYEFLLWAWPELSGQPFVGNWHLAYLCRELEQVANNVGNRRLKVHDLLINVPPGSTKTKLCSIVFPVWCWTKWYWMKFITVSYSSVINFIQYHLVQHQTGNTILHNFVLVDPG